MIQRSKAKSCVLEQGRNAQYRRTLRSLLHINKEMSLHNIEWPLPGLAENQPRTECKHVEGNGESLNSLFYRLGIYEAYNGVLDYIFSFRFVK